MEILIGYNDLASKNPSVASKWHPIKNGQLKPIHLTVGSNKRVWWQCPLGHEWQITVIKIVRTDTCPVCSSRKLLVGFNDLSTLNPEISNEWHPTKNHNLIPAQIISNSSKKIWWQCKSKHEWITGVGARTIYGSGCPRCANHISKAEEQMKEYL